MQMDIEDINKSDNGHAGGCPLKRLYIYHQLNQSLVHNFSLGILETPFELVNLWL